MRAAPPADRCAGVADVAVPPRPAIDPARHARLTRALEARIAVPLPRFAPWFIAAPLASLLPGTDALPGVTGTRSLNALPFGAVGARRLVCLADGAEAVEEVVRHEPGQVFEYQVWGYTTPAAAPVEYGLGRFEFTAAGESTVVRWTYAFALRPDRLPGSLGAVGRAVFRRAFLDTRYADFMASGMAAIARAATADAAARPAPADLGRDARPGDRG